MSFAVSRTAVVAAGARAPPRASAKARVSCALATRAPSGSFFRATHLRGSRTAAPRAAEDDETPAPAPAPEELSFPELSDDEEVKGAQITAIITGVVSVALAVGYLALVQVIDSREMLPPPPEAMGMGECPPGERRC